MLREEEKQLNPLLPGYSFNLFLVAGMTPIIENGPFDFFIDRKRGMSGFIINMTIKGSSKVCDGDDAFYTKPGDLLLFPPGVPHFYGRTPDGPEWYHRWVYFRPRAYWTHWLSWRTQSKKIGRLSLASDALISEFDELFQEIERTYRAGRRSSEELAINLLERLLIRCFEETPENDSSPIDLRVEQACEFMSRNLAEDINVDQVARHVCLSSSRLAHLFRQHIGVNIVRWREDQRMILAKHLLHTTTEPIAKIASQAGYDDQMYFSRIFRKRVGTTPSDFRKSSREKPALDETSSITDAAPEDSLAAQYPTIMEL